MKKLILASASPRRKQILSDAGYEFECITADIDENLGIDDPKTLVCELALLKAAKVAGANRDALVIGSDTVVSVDGKILGKPEDEDDARRMLRLMSGKAHQVYTGICVFDSKTGNATSKYDCTEVYFKNITDEEIEEYLKTGESMDKAGAYAIQGKGGAFVEKTEGNFDNVIGFSISLFEKILAEDFGIFKGE